MPLGERERGDIVGMPKGGIEIGGMEAGIEEGGMLNDSGRRIDFSNLVVPLAVPIKHLS